jgi:hypothetical protein
MSRKTERSFLLVVDAVHRQQVDDVAFLETDAAELHAADLRVRAANVVARLGTGDLGCLPKAAQLCAEHDAPGGRRTGLIATAKPGRLLKARVLRGHQALHVRSWSPVRPLRLRGPDRIEEPHHRVVPLW